MSPSLAALLAAFFFASSSLLTRLGLLRSNPATAVVISNAVNVLVFWTFFLFLLPWNLLISWAVLPFIAAGIAGPFLGRLTLYIGIDRVGVSLATALYDTQVLFAALGGILLFKEDVTYLGGSGVMLLMVGVTFLAIDPSAGNIGRPRHKKTDLLFPLVSGAFFATSYMFRKTGLMIQPNLLLGLPVVSTTSLIMSYIFAQFGPSRLAIPRGSSMIWLIGGGLATCAAQLFSLLAIREGDLTVVVPLQNTQPLVALALAALFLRRFERVTAPLILGVSLVVAGATMVNL
jgi:DME family drug/metabolite transporter